MNLTICPSCGKVNSYNEQVLSSDRQQKVNKASSGTKVKRTKKSARHLSEVLSSETERWVTPMGEFNRVLGGGLVPGAIMLLGGMPGKGKSTLLLQVASVLSHSKRVFYFSNEESEAQIRMRADRLGVNYDDLHVLFHDELGAFIEEVDTIKPDFIIVDSINELYDTQLNSSPGSPSQMRHCTIELQRLAKTKEIPIIVVGQVTKSGELAGENKIQHIVDAVFYLEGDASHMFRILRAEKNRFGSDNEIGVFEMTSRGMEEVSNPSQVILSERASEKPGSVVTVVMEGTRPLLIDLQALSVTGQGGSPARRSVGISRDRLPLVVAVIEKSLRHADLYDQDIFVSVIGGMKISEPFIDMAIALSIISSYIGLPISQDIVVIGELDLTGQFRSVPMIEYRLREIFNLGFTKVITPQLNHRVQIPDGLDVFQVQTLDDAIEAAFGSKFEDLIGDIVYVTKE